MASDRPGDSIVTVVTCEGNFSDPQFPYKLSSLVGRLKRLLYTGDKPFRVTNVEPWNSVRVTFNIPREAAQRLSQLAQAGDRVLRDLGILSVQIEGDQVISLTIAGHFNEPQEIVLQATDDDRPRTSSQVPSSFDLSADGSRASSNVEGSRKNIVQILAQQGNAEAGAVVATASSSLSSSPAAAAATSSSTSSSAASSNAKETFFTGQLVAQADFKSPNVVAPKTEPIQFPLKVTTPSSRTQIPFGPFPFASMTHAMNTMHGSQMHSSQININTVTQTPYPKFSFSPSSPFPSPSPSSAAATAAAGGGGGSVNNSGNSDYQSVKPPTLTSVQSPSSTNTTAITSPTSTTTTTATTTATTAPAATSTTSVVNHLQRAVADRANAALTSPLLVNLLQSDMSGGSQVALSGGGGGGKQTLPPSLAEVTKRKRKPRKPKEETITSVSTSDANSGSLRTSPGSSSRSSLSSVPNSNLECTSTLSLFSQPFNLTPLSPPPLTPPSASPPSLLGQPFVVTPDVILKSSFPSHHHHHHHQIPTLPSPPPTAPSSSTSASNNSGQSSLEAEHELSPWPSPSKRTQHLINPFTGQLEPMSSDDDIDDAHEDVRTSSAKDLFESNNTSLSLSSSNSSSSVMTTFPEAHMERSYRSGVETAAECGEPKVREILSVIKEGVASSFSPESGVQQQQSQQQRTTTNACVSPPSLTTGGGSPSEKIKLRLKLDPKAAESTVTPNLQYKVDVSFVNIPTRRIAGTAGVCENPSLVPASCTVVTTQQSSGCSTSPTAVSGNTSPCASTEPRVPPLHISLRGRNAAVVTSPRKEEKDWCPRLTGRPDFLSSSTTTTATSSLSSSSSSSSSSSIVVGGSDIVASKVPRSRTSRVVKEPQGRCPSVTTPTDISLTAKSTNSSSSSSLMGRRLSLSRGGGHSRRSRLTGHNLASLNTDINQNSQSTLMSPLSSRNSPPPPNPLGEPSAVSSCQALSAEAKEKLPGSPSPQHQPTAAREKALLSGGSLVVEPPHSSKKTASGTVVTGVHLPKIDVNAEGEASVSSSGSCLPTQRVTTTESVEATTTTTLNETRLNDERERFNSMQSPVNNVSDSTNTCVGTVEDYVTAERSVSDEGASTSSSPTTTNNVQNSANEDVNADLVVNRTTAEEVIKETTPVSVTKVISSEFIVTNVASTTGNHSNDAPCVSLLDSSVVSSTELKQEESNDSTNQTPVASKTNPREALCETAAAKTEQSTVDSLPSQSESTTLNDSREIAEENVEEEVTAVALVTPPVPSENDVKSEDSKTFNSLEIETNLSVNDSERLTSCSEVKLVESVNEEALAFSRDVGKNSLTEENVEDETSRRAVDDNVAVRTRTTFENEPLILSTPKDVIVPSVQLALSPPMISSRVDVDTAAPFLTPQGKLRVASVALRSPNISCLVASDGGTMLVEGLPPLSAEEDGEGDVDFESTRTTTSHHHHRHHQLSRSSTTVLASISDSPCSASPSGSSPDSLLTNTGGEESGGDQGSGGSGNSSSSSGGSGAGGEQGSDKRHGAEEKGRHQSISRRSYRGGGSPYEDSGVESMDATTEKSSGGESPCEIGNENFINVVESNNSEQSNLVTDSDGGAKEGDHLLKLDSVSEANTENEPSTVPSGFSPDKDNEPEISEGVSPRSNEAEDVVLSNETVEEDDSLSNEIKSEKLEITTRVPETEVTEEANRLDDGCKASRETTPDVQSSSAEPETVTSDVSTTITTPPEPVLAEPAENPPTDREIKDEVSVKDSDETVVSRPPTADEKKTGAGQSTDEEETNVFLEGHSINGQGSLLASVVFGDQVMAVGDELACGSPSDATTTQLLVFTVEDGESIVVTEDSEHHMSLLRLTQADGEDPTSTLHFSTLESGESGEGSGDIGVHLGDNTAELEGTPTADEKEGACGSCEAATVQTQAEENQDGPSETLLKNEPGPESPALEIAPSIPRPPPKRTLEQNDTSEEISDKIGQMQPLALPQISPVLNCGSLTDGEPTHSDTLLSETHRSVALPIKFVAIPSNLNSHLTRQGSTTTSSDSVSVLTTTNAVESSTSSALKMLINRNSPTADEFHSVTDVSRRCSLTPPLLKHHHHHHHHNQAPPLSPKLRCVNESVIFSPLASTSSMLTPLHSEESQSSPSVNAVVNHAPSSDGNRYHPAIRRKLGYDDLDGVDSDSSTSSMSNDLSGDYKDQEDTDGDSCFMGITSVTSGDHNYIFRASSMPKRLRGTKRSQTPPPGHHSNSNSSNSVETIKSNSVPEDANGDLSTNESESLAQLSVEIPSDEPERRSTRNTRSNSMLCSPDKGSSTAQSSPDSSHSNSHSRTMTTNDLEGSEKETEAVDGELRALSNRVKRKREDSDSDSEKKSVLLTLTSAVVINADKEEREATTNSTVHHIYPKPVKRKCSENAVELIKACIGVEDAPTKRTGAVKQQVVDGARHVFNRNAKSKEEITNKTKVGQYSTVTTSEGSSDDEVTLSELATKTRAVKSKQVTTNVDYPAVTPRNVTRNAKQKQNVKASASSGVMDEELGRISGAGGRGKNGRAVGTSRKESRKEAKEGSGSRGGNRGGRAQEKTNNKKIKEQNDRSSSPSLGASALSAHTSAQNKPSTEEVGGGKRKLRSSGSSGYYNSLPQKRRRFSRDNR